MLFERVCASVLKLVLFEVFSVENLLCLFGYNREVIHEFVLGKVGTVFVSCLVQRFREDF